MAGLCRCGRSAILASRRDHASQRHAAHRGVDVSHRRAWSGRARRPQADVRGHADPLRWASLSRHRVRPRDRPRSGDRRRTVAPRPRRGPHRPLQRSDVTRRVGVARRDRRRRRAVRAPDLRRHHRCAPPGARRRHRQALRRFRRRRHGAPRPAARPARIPRLPGDVAPGGAGRRGGHRFVDWRQLARRHRFWRGAGVRCAHRSRAVALESAHRSAGAGRRGQRLVGVQRRRRPRLGLRPHDQPEP